MIQIITDTKPLEQECDRCKCKFIYEKEDIYKRYFGGFLFHDGYTEFVKCPRCNKEISLGDTWLK